MTLLGRLVSLFPMIYLSTLFLWIFLFISSPKLSFFFILILWPFLFPLVCFRIHNFFFPVSEGFFDLTKRTYNSWWGSHQFQYPFIVWPWLESTLHMVPGLFSIWLRAWGAKIGQNVFWTPQVQILDRNLVEIGSGSVLGHLTAMSSHMVADIEGRPQLVIKKVIIGSKCFIGADSQFGPGVVIEDGRKIKPKTRLFWRGEWKGA